MSQKATTAREFRDKYGKEMPTLKLARIMLKETNHLFKDVEDARTVLRYIEGKSGYKLKENTKHNKYFADERSKNPYQLPKSDETSYEPFVLKGHKRVAVFSDIHVPYHSTDAITAALDFCKKEKPDALLINGDILDCFQLSRFIKDPRKRHFAEELKVFKEVIDIFKKVLNCKIYLKYGNHEERYENFLFVKAKELIGVEDFELDNIIKARANGIDVIKDKRIIHANGLNIIHGHEFSTGFFSPVNVARGLFLRGKTSALQGHSHAYAPINKWNLGFAIVDLDGNKSFNVRNKRIYKGEVL